MLHPLHFRHVVIAASLCAVAQFVQFIGLPLPPWLYLAANLLPLLTALLYVCHRLSTLVPHDSHPIVNGLGGTNIDHAVISINRKIRTRLDASEVLSRAQSYLAALPIGFRFIRQGAHCLHVIVPAGQRTLMAFARMEHSLRIAVTPRQDGTDVRIFGDAYVEWYPMIDDLVAHLAS
jgi:hypothetical protein